LAHREASIRGAAAPADEHEPAPGAPALADTSVAPSDDEPRLSLFDAADLAAPADPPTADVDGVPGPPAAALQDPAAFPDPVPSAPAVGAFLPLDGDPPPAGPAAPPAADADSNAPVVGAFLPYDDDPPLAELFPDGYAAEDVTRVPDELTADPAVLPGPAVRPRARQRKKPPPAAPAAPPSPPLPPVDPGRAAETGHALAAQRSLPFVFDPLRPYRGLVRRFFVVYRHVLGLLAGGAVAYVRALPRERRHGLKSWFPRLTASLVWPFLDRGIRRLSFAQQLRRRLEILGPTYIKLGQIMAIREDLLPRSITGELANLFDRLPAIPFVQVREIIEESLGRPLEELYRAVDEKPLGSASIAQAHRAVTLDGEVVVVKVIKPGVAEMIESDLTLLGMVGGFMQWVLPRYQPRQIIAEFSAYTRKEVDYSFEADNAETFSANFRDMEDVAFPRIHRALSSRTVLTMEFMDGLKPGSEAASTLTQAERERVIDLGAAAIIRMLYRDGFFHADLHAGNLMIFPGKRVKMGFIDLGMVGRFEERTRRQMLYYFHALVSGDVDGATRYLADMATVGKGGDPQGFRRAVTDLSRRFVTHASRGEISIAQLILESVGLGGRYRVFFPVEMTLMVKALVTFEGVGRTLDPQLDVAAVSQKHVSKIFQQQFDPRLLMRQILRGSPELVDMAVRLPQLLSAGFKFADEHLNNRSPANPLQGIKGSILAAACIVGGVLSVIQHASPWFSGAMFLLAVLLAAFGK
jgi:ubiquinone biosynthesis protein